MLLSRAGAPRVYEGKGALTSSEGDNSRVTSSRPSTPTPAGSITPDRWRPVWPRSRLESPNVIQPRPGGDACTAGLARCRRRRQRRPSTALESPRRCGRYCGTGISIQYTFLNIRVTRQTAPRNRSSQRAVANGVFADYQSLPCPPMEPVTACH